MALTKIQSAGITDNSVTGDKIAVGSDAQGDVLYYNGTDYVRLAAGTDGQFLKTQGSSANPAWANAGGDNTPSFGVYLASDQSYSNDTWTKMTMNTEEWDSDSAYDHSTNYRFTVPANEGGKYFFSLTTTVTVSSAAQDLGSIKLALYKNGSAFKQEWFDGAGARHQYRGMTLTAVLNLAATDYIEFYCSAEGDAATANSIGGQSYTFCTGFKLL